MDVYTQAISEFCNNIDNIVFLLDKNLNISYVNPAAESFFDQKNEKFTSQPFLQIIKTLVNETPFTKATFEATRLPQSFKSIINNKGSNPFHIHWHVSIIHSETTPTLYTILGNIISADKHNLGSNLKSLANFMPGDLYWKNKAGEYLGCNQTVLDKLKVKSISSIIGKTDEDLWPETAKAIRENDLIVMESKKPFTTEETIQIPDQPEMIFATIKAPLLDKNNQVIGIIGNSLDITAQKNAEKNLKHAKELAERNNQLKTEFIHNTQHDIRTPLSGIYGCSEILMSEEQDPEKKSLLQHIQQATQCVLDYCSDIVEFSKMDSGTIPICIKPIDYQTLLNKVITLEKPALTVKNLDFSLHYDIEEEAIITSDSFRLERILINLISNAIKFTFEGSITLHTWIEKKTLCICIKDTGIGIPKNQQDIIFDIFVRLTESDSSPFDGQGLGLSLVKRFVSDLSGKIDVDSEEAKGSTFIISLPMSDVTEAATAA